MVEKIWNKRFERVNVEQDRLLAEVTVKKLEKNNPEMTMQKKKSSIKSVTHSFIDQQSKASCAEKK